jgi:hypothetical protein
MTFEQLCKRVLTLEVVTDPWNKVPILLDYDIAAYLGADVNKLNEHATKSSCWKKIKQKVYEPHLRFQLSPDEHAALLGGKIKIRKNAAAKNLLTPPWAYTHRGCVVFFSNAFLDLNMAVAASEIPEAFVVALPKKTRNKND